MDSATFHRRFRLLIAATWAIPPFFGLGFLVFVVELFTLKQLGQMLLTLPLPVYVIGAQLGSDVYFRRFARPIVDYLEDPDDPAKERAALARARRFPRDFWLLFLLYLLCAPVAVMWSASLGYGFEPTPVDWFRIELVSLVVSIIVGLPIFLLVVDVFGRVFSRVRWTQPQVPLTTKVFLIGALVPLLIDTMLVQYYWTETGYFTATTFLVWLVLELLAIAGAVLAVRSFRQGLAPLDALVREKADPNAVDISKLEAQSTDELGVLASGYKELLGRFHEQNAILTRRNALLREAREASDTAQLIEVIRAAIRGALHVDEAVVVVRKDEELHIPLAEETLVLGRDRAPLLWEAIEAQGYEISYHDLENESFDAELAARLQCRSAVIAPLRGDASTLGALVAICHGPCEGTNEYELDALEALSLDAATLLSSSLARDKQEELEHQLLAAQKMEVVGRLAGGIAHDFNNLLTVVIGSASLLEIDLEDQRTEVETIIETAERAATLTRQLLTFSKSQLVRPTVLDLNDLTRGVTRVLERLVPSSMTLAIELEKKPYRVRADRGQLEQVLLNLVVNARDAIVEGGRVVVATESATFGVDESVPAGDWAVIRVSDDGVGMSPEVIEQIFEPYFTTKTSDRGTGLGLATVYGIVSQAGGHIRVESTPGQGTTFRVYLPRTESMETLEPTSRTTRPPTGKRALLVEDDPMLRDVIARTLERCGVAVVATAGRGDVAVELADDEALEIDLVISDVVLPGLLGLDVVRRIREKRPAVRVLLISGYADSETIDAIAESGIPFLPKPFTPDQLTAKLAELEPSSSS